MMHTAPAHSKRSALVKLLACDTLTRRCMLRTITSMQVVAAEKMKAKNAR